MASLQQFNLFLQVFIFVVLSVSIFFLKKNRSPRSFTLHGRLMLGAILLNFISFLLVMGPSILGLRQFIIERPTHILTISTILHASFGTIAEVVGGYVTFTWLPSSSVKKCIGKKALMRLTLIVWVIALISGFIEYVVLYVW